jgi:hypothetical protein
MRYDDIRLRKYISSDPTYSFGNESVGVSRSFNVTISGILQDTPVTLTVTNGSITTTADMLVEAADHMSHFALTGSAAGAAGEAQEVTITAIGESGDPFVLYSGEHSFTLSGANSIGEFTPTCNDVALGSSTTLNFTNGVAHCALKLYKAENALIAASDGTYLSSGSELSVAVSPAALSRFELSVPETAVSETAFPITVGLEDAYGNVEPTFPNPYPSSPITELPA